MSSTGSRSGGGRRKGRRTRGAADANGGGSGRKVSIAGVDQLALLGPGDCNLRYLEQCFGGNLTVRGDHLLIDGPANMAVMIQDVVADLLDRIEAGQHIDTVTLSYLWQHHSGEGPDGEDSAAGSETLLFASGSRRAVRTKSVGQERFVESVREHDLVFAIGPAGTGKTFLAVVMAMDYLKRKLVDKIVLVRPAVEAGEQLGFLPGDLQEKINPYLRPLYDALSDLTGPSRIARYMAAGVIEASPLAYMRGRTLNNAFVILDEAQNTTIGQMKMFLTRLGLQSKAVVTGDVTQIDLPGSQQSGLIHVAEILQETSGVGFVNLDGRDVVRHPLVRRIVDAFDAAAAKIGDD